MRPTDADFEQQAMKDFQRTVVNKISKEEQFARNIDRLYLITQCLRQVNEYQSMLNRMPVNRKVQTFDPWRSSYQVAINLMEKLNFPTESHSKFYNQMVLLSDVYKGKVSLSEDH